MESREAGERLTRIYALLYALGARANLCGFRYVSCAIALASENPELLKRPEERLYPEIARRYHTEPEEASRNMRRVIFRIWKRNPQGLEKLAGAPLHAYPSPKQFCAFACRYLEKSR